MDEQQDSVKRTRGKKMWLIFVVVIPFIALAGWYLEFMLYRAQCCALTVALPGHVRHVALNMQERSERGEPVEHILEILLEDFPDMHKRARFQRCVNFRARDAQWGRYSWQDYLDGNVSQEELLAEAMRYAGPKPRWDRFGPIAFLIADSYPIETVPVIAGRIDQTRGNGASFYYIRLDGSTIGSVRGSEDLFQELEWADMPHPPDDIWSLSFERR